MKSGFGVFKRGEVEGVRGKKMGKWSNINAFFFCILLLCVNLIVYSGGKCDLVAHIVFVFVFFFFENLVVLV